MIAADFREQPVVFACNGDRMIGIVSVPRQPEVDMARGVLVVVGGPQYRAGSHRQFTLMCRDLAANGIAALRFDYRGMGDAEGEQRPFDDIDEDIGAAIDAFCAHVPAIREVVICGLCDAASATMFYAHRDSRVAGIVLINPWARTEAGIAKAQLRHYYSARLADREFWRKLVHGEVAVGSALRSAASVVRAAMSSARVDATADATADAAPDAAPDAASNVPGGRERSLTGPAASAVHGAARPSNMASALPRDLPLPERMAEGLARFAGHVLLVRSGNDLTAQEFTGMADASPRWRELLAGPRMQLRELPDADHTFSRREWRDRIVGWTTSWAHSW